MRVRIGSSWATWLVVCWTVCVWVPDAWTQDAAEAPPSGTYIQHAARRTGPIKIDGRLDEGDWLRAPQSSAFIERTPVPGRVPAVKTEIKILFDEDAIYVGARLALDEGVEPRALQMERDSFDIWADEALTLKFDVRHDKRTTMGFVVNPANTQLDYIALENGGRRFAASTTRCGHRRPASRQTPGTPS